MKNFNSKKSHKVRKSKSSGKAGSVNKFRKANSRISSDEETTQIAFDVQYVSNLIFWCLQQGYSLLELENKIREYIKIKLVENHLNPAFEDEIIEGVYQAIMQSMSDDLSE